MKKPDNKDEKIKKNKQEISALYKELEIQKWAVEKTKKGIKLLYLDLEQKNQRLLQLDQLKSEFVSTVSHELRTPMTVIKEGISQVLEGLLGEVNQDQKEFLAISLEGINQLKKIIDDLLDISKIEANKVSLDREWVYMIDLLKDMHKIFKIQAEKKGLELIVDKIDPELEVYVDKGKIKQIFNNLMNNAFKFTRKGSIRISVIERKNEVECKISDTGEGVSKTDLPRMFNKFEQFGRGMGPGEKGTGLGLAICKGIIELHGGRIKAESQLNRGTTVSFILPKLKFLEKKHKKQNLTEKKNSKKSS